MTEHNKELKDLDLATDGNVRREDYSPNCHEPGRYRYQPQAVGTAATVGELAPDRSLAMANFAAELASLSGHYR